MRIKSAWVSYRHRSKDMLAVHCCVLWSMRNWSLKGPKRQSGKMDRDERQGWSLGYNYLAAMDEKRHVQWIGFDRVSRLRSQRKGHDCGAGRIPQDYLGETCGLVPLLQRSLEGETAEGARRNGRRDKSKTRSCLRPHVWIKLQWSLHDEESIAALQWQLQSFQILWVPCHYLQDKAE